MSNFIKKSFTWGVVLTTVVWSLGIAALTLNVSVASAAQDGDLIKMAGNSAVYWLLGGKRYVFPNDKAYFTWFSDFSGVVTVSQSELQSYAIGGNVTYRPGTRLIKITTDPKTYAVEPGGKLVWVTSEAIAVSLYGSNWNKKIDDVPDPFFVNYTSGADITSAQYPVGSLVKESGSTTTYYIAAGMTKRAFASDAAFSANRYKAGDVLAAAAGGLASYSAGSSLTGKEDSLANYGGMAGGGGAVSAGGTLSLLLSASTPASGTAVKGALIPFTVIDATATGGDVVIDSLVGQRGGIAQDSVFSDISVLVDGAQMGLDKTLNSAHQFTLFDDITIPSGQTKKITLRGNTAASLTSNVGETPVLGFVQMTLKQGTLSAALPIYGNAMTVNNSVSVGTITVTAGSLNPSLSTQKIGTLNYVLAEVQLAVGSAEDVEVQEIIWDQAGSADDTDISNVQLVSDGVVLATMEHPVNKKAHFKLSPAMKIEKGKNKSFAIRANLDSGSNRTVDFDIEKDSDLLAKGLTYGYYILAGTWPASSDPRFNGVVTTIDTGTLKVEPVATPSNKVAEGADDQVLGMFNFEAKGEEVQITRLGVQVRIIASSNATVATTSDVTNVTVYDENGVAIAGPTDPTFDYGSGITSFGSATTTDTISVPAGVHKYTVKATLSSDFAVNNTIQVNLTPGNNITAKGATTGKTITATPATVQSSTTQTVQIGSLVGSVQTTPVAQTVVAGTNGFTFANLVLDAQASGEDMRVTQIKSAQHTTGSAYPALISGLKLYDGSTELVTSNDPDPTSTTAAASATSTFTFVNALVVPKGTSKTVTIKGNISKSVTSGSVAFGLQNDATNAISATGVDTGNSITPTYNYSDGQSMTLASAGTLSLSPDASTPIAGLIPSQTTGLSVGVIAASAQHENVNIEKIYVSVTDVNSGGPDQFDKIWLTDGTKTVGVTPTSSDSATSPTTMLFDMSLDPFVVAVGSTKLLTIKVDTANVDRSNASKGSSGEGFQLSINATGDVTARGASSGTDATVSGAPTFNAFTLYRSTPTYAAVALSNAFGSGLRELSKFTLSADPKGPVAVYKFTFGVSTGSISYVRDFYVNDSGYAQGPVTAITQHDTSAVTNPDILEFLFDTDSGGIANGGEMREIPAGGSRTFTLFGTVTDDGTAGGSVSVSLLGDHSFPSTVVECAGTTTGDNACTGVDSDDQNDFIWGDLAYTVQYNSSTATNTAEWTNGFRVKGLLTTTTPQSL